MKKQELTNASQQAIQQYKNAQVFSYGNWENTAKSIASLKVPAHLQGPEDSFMQTSELLSCFVNQMGGDDLTISQLIVLSMSAKAIQDGDARAAAFVRDTSGGKPVDKVDNRNVNPLHNLPDEALDMLLSAAQVQDDNE